MARKSFAEMSGDERERAFLAHTRILIVEHRRFGRLEGFLDDKRVTPEGTVEYLVVPIDFENRRRVPEKATWR